MAKSSVKHRAISVRQGNNLAILAHKTGINRPASTYACVWKKIQGEADRHETDPPPAAQHAQRHAVVRDVVQLEPAGDERDGLPHEIGRSQIFCQLIDPYQNGGCQQQDKLKHL